MNKNNLDITESDLFSANNYIQRKFSAQSWWPKEQPEEALREYNLLNGSAAALNLWCEKWLDSGQQQQLAKSIRP